MRWLDNRILIILVLIVVTIVSFYRNVVYLALTNCLSYFFCLSSYLFLIIILYYC